MLPSLHKTLFDLWFKYNFLAIVWISIVSTLTLISGATEGNLSSVYADKLAHFFMYAVMVVLLIVGCMKQYNSQFIRSHAIKLAIAFSFVWSILLESIQSFIPSRSFDIQDILANLVGCIVGYGVFYVIYQS